MFVETRSEETSLRPIFTIDGDGKIKVGTWVLPPQKRMSDAVRTGTGRQGTSVGL